MTATLRRESTTPRVPTLLWVPAALAVVVSLAPLWYLVTQATSRGWSPLWREVWRQSTASLVARSLILTAAVTIACAVVGTFAAWVVSHSGVKNRTLLTIAFSLPLAIPSYLSAFAWVSRWPELAGFWGAFIVLTFASFPYVMLPTMAAMSAMDPVHEDIAQTLGLRPWQVFWQVTLPQVRRPVLAGSLLVALYALSDFGAVATMRHEVFTWVIYGAYRAGFNPTRAAILSLVLVALAMMLTSAESRARGRASASRVDAGLGTRRGAQSLRVRALALVGSAVIIAPAVGIPVAGVIEWLGWESQRSVPWTQVWSATLSSFGVGVAVSAATLAIAVPVAIIAARHSGRLARAVEATTYVTHSLPGIVVAISVVYIGVRALRPLYQQWPIVVFAHVILFLPVMIASTKAAIEKSSPVVEDVARTLGASGLATFFRVTLPIAAPGLAAGTALTMLAAVKELPATLLLRPTGLDTLSTEIWRYSSISDYSSLGPFALAMLVVAAVPTAILGTLSTVRDSK